MIAKMNFVSITGPRGDIDRIVDKYLTRYEIHLEYAPSELKTVATLRPYIEQNIYRDHLTRMKELAEKMGVPEYENVDTDVKRAADKIDFIYDELGKYKSDIEEIEKQMAIINTKLEKVMHFRGMEHNIDEILEYKFLKYRFGRIPKEHYDKFDDYSYDSLESVFIKCSEDEHYVWGIYFVSKKEKESVDAIYASLHFERTYMPNDIKGRPDDLCRKYEDRLSECEKKIADIQDEMNKLLLSNKKEFDVAYNRLKRYSMNFDIRKYAACTKESGVSYYIICGWMDEKQANSLKNRLDKYEKDTVCIIDDKHETVDTMPPTKLKNPKIFKPFEMYIKMYGLPAYNELDPTMFVALTYAFIFGAMFGDVGQGAVLCLGGFLLYKIKKIDLAAIISAAGFFSTIFGFMFGSVFGFENIIHAVWLHPSKAMVNVPFIGKLNTVFIVAIGFGMALILVTMILNIINAIKSKDKERLLFDTNGIAGLIFYGAVAAVLGLFMAGKPLPAAMVLLVMFGLPLLLMAFKEPLMHLLEKKKKHHDEHKDEGEKEKEGIVMFFVQMFFEMFEVLLSYFSNTLSFVRIGAFAVSHAAMMEVVLMLAGAENGSTGNILVIVLGNLFVCGLEGLIVGIQVLRLEYYEMFSRFYKGNGREFKPYNAIDSTK